MFRRFLDWLIGCHHPRLTWPIKFSGDKQAHRTCLDCGKEILYRGGIE